MGVGQTSLTLAQRIQTAWFQKDFAVFLWPLLPLSYLFAALTATRRFFYRKRWLKSERLSVPVIVIGNVIVGGAGKTPLTLYVVQRLRAAGWQPGIISRGYAGLEVAKTALEVFKNSDPDCMGDEPVLLAQRSGVPVFVARRRALAGQALCAAYPHVDILVCDDGLQHYALARDVELALVDERAAGNSCLLPAGPLREPWSRLHSVDAVLQNFGSGAAAASLSFAGRSAFAMRLCADDFYALQDSRRRCNAEALRGRRLYALAGIAVPERFFTTLQGMGLEFISLPFPDHHRYQLGDLLSYTDGVLLMTEKDAVKCAALFNSPQLKTQEAWVLPISAAVEPDLLPLVLERINGRQTA